MRTFSMLVMALLLVFSASSAIAQDTQQPNEAAQDTEPIIAGDVNSESLAVVRNYWPRMSPTPANVPLAPCRGVILSPRPPPSFMGMPSATGRWT